MEAISVAKSAGVGHFIYVSVAHPAPAMHAYIATRSACEAELVSTGLNATILRPWYVLGPGHRWPYALIPFYWIAGRIPATREGARRLGLVTRQQMIGALARAVEQPARGNSNRRSPRDSRRKRRRRLYDARGFGPRPRTLALRPRHPRIHVGLRYLDHRPCARAWDVSRNGDAGRSPPDSPWRRRRARVRSRRKGFCHGHAGRSLSSPSAARFSSVPRR